MRRRIAALLGLAGVAVGAWLSGLGGQTMTDPVMCAGYEAVTQNPAALMLRNGPDASLNWFSARLQLASSGLTLREIVSYFGQPRFITDEDKQAILGHVGGRNQQVEARVDLEVLHGHFRQFGAALDYSSVLRQTLPPDLFELVLCGNELERTYDLSGLATDSLSLLRATMATAFGLGCRIAVGAGVSWLHGFKYVLTTASTGAVLTTRYAVTGFVSQERQQATGGDGLALCLGGIAQLGDRWRLGLSLRDLPALVCWHSNAGTRRFTVHLDSLDAARYRVRPSLDSFLIKTNTFDASDVFWTTVPGVLAAGLSYQPRTVFRCGVMANAQLWSEPFFPKPPLVAARLDLRPIELLHLNLTPGWHKAMGPGGHVALGFFHRGVGLTVDVEMWGFRSAHSGCARLRLGYDF